MMKILLINPPETATKDSLTLIGLPLGLLHIASILEKNHKNVRIFDSITFSEKLIEKDIGDNMKHIGASWKKIEYVIRKTMPEVIGISNHFSSQIENTFKIAQIAKNIDKKIKVVVGGPHASSNPQDFFEKKCIDFVIRGEGEFSFAELINELKKEKQGKKAQFDKINNLAYIKNQKIRINPSKLILKLDELPLPAYHLINMENYFRLIERGLGRISLEKRNKRKISIITSRGCPFNCIFCSIHGHMGRKWRAYSSEYVIKHVKHLVEKYRVDHISFEDDNLILDTKRFERILDGLKKNNIKTSWDTPNGIRADGLDFELLKKMKKTGCNSIKIGIESGDQDIINRIVRKNLDLKKVVQVAEICKKLEIPLGGFFIMGLPGETKENIQNTLRFAYMLKKKYYVDPVMTIAMPLIGTRMYDICKEKNYLTKGFNPSEFGSKNSLIIETENFDIEYLKKERKKFYKKIIFLQISQILKKPSMILRYTNLLRNPKNIINILNYLIKTK